MKLRRFITSLNVFKANFSEKYFFLKFFRMCTKKFVLSNVKIQTVCEPLKIEASNQRCSKEKVFWKSEQHLIIYLRKLVYFLVKLAKMSSIARVFKELHLDFVQLVRVFESFQNTYFAINKIHQIRNKSRKHPTSFQRL